MPLCGEVEVLLPAARAGPVLDLSRLSREHLVDVSEACPVGESNPHVGGCLNDAPFAVAVAAYVGVSLENCEATRVAGSDLPWEGFQALFDVVGEANCVSLGCRFSSDNSEDVCHTLLLLADNSPIFSQLRRELSGDDVPELGHVCEWLQQLCPIGPRIDEQVQAAQTALETSFKNQKPDPR